MTITTKYDVEDMVWLISDNKAINQKVTSIYADSCMDNMGQVKAEIRYNIQFCSMSYKESELFKTKEDLLQSL